MARYYIHGVPTEKLILEPADYSREEWATILKVFGMEYAERIVISNYMFEAIGKLKEDEEHTSHDLKKFRLSNPFIGGEKYGTVE